jgi:hypothetical protein
MPREDGLETNAAGENGKWYCEDEPVPSIMDTWGRGAIPMKKKIKVDISAVRRVSITMPWRVLSMRFSLWRWRCRCLCLCLPIQC